MVKVLSAAAALVAVATPFVKAQTFSECNPLTKTGCAANAGLNSQSYTVDFTKGVPSEWKMTYQDVTTSSGDGAKFTINSFTDGPTMQSNFYIFFGKVEAVVKSAPGAGIISSFILESDTLDELDWEMIGSQTTQVQSNYFGKGNTTTYDRGQFHPVSTPADTYHTYTIDWKQDTTTWSIDGKVVRTLNFADAIGGKNYPQTPMNIRLGNWVGGQPNGNKGTIEWAGGIADMSKAPFNMFVKSITVTNYNPSASYSYSDKSGSRQSIQKSNKAIDTSSSSSSSASSSSGSSSGESSSGNTGNTKPSIMTESTLDSTSTKTNPVIVNGGASTVTINPGQQGSASTALAFSQPSTGPGVVDGSYDDVVPMSKLNTVTVNIAGNGTTPTGLAKSSGSVVTVKTGSGYIPSGTSTSRPAQVTTNAATKTGGSGVAVCVVLGMALFVL